MELESILKMINKSLLFIILVNGLIFLRSSWGKFADDKFANGLAGTLAKFASKNPYPFYKSFLESVAIPNSQLFAVLTMTGELFAALTLVLGSIYLLLNKKNQKNQFVTLVLRLGLVVGLFLNVSFWLASAWTSPSTDGLNLLMAVVQLIALVYISKLTA